MRTVGDWGASETCPPWDSLTQPPSSRLRRLYQCTFACHQPRRESICKSVVVAGESFSENRVSSTVADKNI